MSFDFSSLTYRPPTEPTVPIVRPPKAAFPKMVVHCKRDRYDVLVDRTTSWGNPFRIGPDGDRDAVICKFKDWIVRQPGLLARLPELRGKVLGCWCHPKPCHGDFLAEVANGMTPDTILELWQERAAIQLTDNVELLEWHRLQDSPKRVVRRHCELCASAEISLRYGDYAGWIIRPHITKEAS